MAEPLVLSALAKKRAEIDGALRDTEKRVAQLRAERDVIDAAIRIFDPSRVPNKIKPILRRPKPRMFRHGQCSRAVFEMLRVAETPMTVRAIAERLVTEHHLDVKEKADLEKLITKVRNTLLRKAGNGLVREQIGADVTWRIG